MGRDGIVMATQDADSGAPSSSRDSLPGLPQAAELVRDAYGLPMQDVSPVGRTYRASPASRGGVVSVGLGITDMVAYDILPGYVAYPGMAVGLLTLGLRRNAEKKMTGPETRGRRIALRAAGMLGMLGFLLLVAGTGHGDALNNAS
jgi:hypothetical protein